MIADAVELAPEVDAWFTGRDPERGGGNLSHRRPHRPDTLARARELVGEISATSPGSWHLMHQVHGSEVGIVTDDTPPGAELRGVDALVTTSVDRPLVVQVADCVPVLVAGMQVVAAVHAGRLGVANGIVDEALQVIRDLETDPTNLRAAIGPAIGGCCYEVPAAMHAEMVRSEPAAAATTTWGTPALDLPNAVVAQLVRSGVGAVERVGGCTRCDPKGRWFSHRADPSSGRQIGLVVRRSPRGENADPIDEVAR